MFAVRLTKILLMTAILAASLPLAACEEEGPAERAGKAFDEAAKDTKRAVQDAVD